MDNTKNNNITPNTGSTGTAASRSRTEDSNIKENLGDAITGDKEAAKEIYSEAKDKAGQAVGKVYEKISDTASTKITEQKSQIADGLSTVADSLRKVDENIQNSDKETSVANMTGKYTGSLAGQIESLANYLDTKEVGDMVKDIEGFARRNPTVFIGGAFVAGLLLARFIKSSGSRKKYTSNAYTSMDDSKPSKDEFEVDFTRQPGVTGIDSSKV